MKKLLLLFSLLLSFNSHGEWKDIALGAHGEIYYIDTDTITERDGYVFYWYMRDYLKPTESGVMSGKLYVQGECEKKREKHLTFVSYKLPMAKGNGVSATPLDQWNYLSHGSIKEYIFDYVCDYFN